MQRLHERPATDLFSHDATRWMALVYQFDTRTHGLASGYSSVVMVQPTQDRMCDHLVACTLSARN